MKRYLLVLCCMMALALIPSWLWLKPIFSLSFFIGLASFAVFLAGIISWHYFRDGERDRDERWVEDYFCKDYSKELRIWLLVTIVFLALGYFIRQSFFHAFFSTIGGVFSALCLNIGVEWAYKAWVLKSDVENEPKSE